MGKRTKRRKKSKRRPGKKLAQLVRRLPPDLRADLHKIVAWFSSDEPERLAAWWTGHGGSLDASIAHVRAVRDEFASREAERRANDPRRGQVRVSPRVVLAAFDRHRQRCASDTEAARRVAQESGGKVSRNTVLARVRERRAGK